MSVQSPEALGEGSVLEGPERVVTLERLVTYGDGMLSAAGDKPVKVGANIHTDYEFARRQGLPGPIVDGMLSTNYISEMLLRVFGRWYIENGELRTKFIKPVLVDTMLRTGGRVVQAEGLPNDGVRYLLEVWTEDRDGQQMVLGEATVTVPKEDS